MESAGCAWRVHDCRYYEIKPVARSDVRRCEYEGEMESRVPVRRSDCTDQRWNFHHDGGGRDHWLRQRHGSARRWAWPGMGGSIFTALYRPIPPPATRFPRGTNPLLPGPPCIAGGTIGDYSSARSQHPGGVNVFSATDQIICDRYDRHQRLATYATRNAAGASASGVKESPPASAD